MTALCGSSQECSKDTKDFGAVNSDKQQSISHLLQKKKCFFGVEMEEAAVLGNRLKLMLPLQLNPTQNYGSPVSHEASPGELQAAGWWLCCQC